MTHSCHPRGIHHGILEFSDVEELLVVLVDSEEALRSAAAAVAAAARPSPSCALNKELKMPKALKCPCDFISWRGWG